MEDDCHSNVQLLCDVQRDDGRVSGSILQHEFRGLFKALKVHMKLS
jgi:hypothetical protein